MSEITKILVTSSLTIIGGVFIFATGQILSKFIIEPIHEQKRIIGEIADALVFYANVYGNPGVCPPKEMEETSKRLRQLATLLHSKSHIVPKYEWLEKLKFVPASAAIQAASRELIGLSNSVFGRVGDQIGVALENNNRADRIKKALDLKFTD
jgi:hypothetical protein